MPKWLHSPLDKRNRGKKMGLGIYQGSTQIGRGYISGSASIHIKDISREQKAFLCFGILIEKDSTGFRTISLLNFTDGAL